MIKVIIIDDHRMFIDGMKSFLSNQDNIQVVATATSGEEALEILKEKKVDIAILDMRMPGGMYGEEVLDVIQEKYVDVKVLVVSMSEDERDIQRMLHNGAHGYLLKDRGMEEVVGALNMIQRGERYIPVSIALKAIPMPKKRVTNVQLTAREMDVLYALSEGLTDKEIGTKLFIAPTTVETHCRNMRRKTKTNNRMLLVNYARENGILRDRKS